jgi:4-hydroxy-tetrahydrodipicolinate synthase
LNRFELAKGSFSDSKMDFINIPIVNINYQKLLQSLVDKNIPITLLYGTSGSGKSTLAKMALNEIKGNNDTLLLNTRFLNKNTFIEQIYQFLKIDKPDSLSEAIEELFNVDRRINIILDEANLYSYEELEFIRELSNTKSLRFVIITYDNLLLKKSYFKSRIWNIIEVNNLGLKDLIIYIEKKLIDNDLYYISKLFTKQNYRLIYKLSKGSFRDINKLLYRMFEICIHYSEKKDITHIKNRYIEMAGIDLGFIDV